MLSLLNSYIEDIKDGADEYLNNVYVGTIGILKDDLKTHKSQQVGKNIGKGELDA